MRGWGALTQDPLLTARFVWSLTSIGAFGEAYDQAMLDPTPYNKLAVLGSVLGLGPWRKGLGLMRAADVGYRDLPKLVLSGRMPRKVFDELELIRRTGRSSFDEGKIYANIPIKLPKEGRYMEYYVRPYNTQTGNRGMNQERLVIDVRSGKAWYTRDHHQSYWLVE